LCRSRGKASSSHKPANANGSSSFSTGFDDVAILQITLIASWFNYINRVADALGRPRCSLRFAGYIGPAERCDGERFLCV
jgi:hypothetical protein